MSHFNPFDLLGDEGNPRKTAPKPSKPAAPKPTTPKAPATVVRKPAAPSTKAAPQQQAQATAKAAPAPGNAAPAKKENGQAQGGDAQKGKNEGAKGSPRPQGDRRGPRPQGDRPPRPQGDRPPRPQGDRPPRPQGDRPPRPQGDRPPREDQPVDGAPDKAPRRPKGDRRTGPNPHRGRQFDRRSGTGRSPTENKKGGAGKANWGSNVEDAIEVGKEKPEGEKEEVEKVHVVEGAATEEPKPEPEKEVKGLDEYLAELKTKAVKIEAPKQRSAGEGVDQSQWAGFVPIQKEDLGQDEFVKNKKKDGKKEEAPATVETFFYHPPPQRNDDRRRPRNDQQRGPKGGKGGFRNSPRDNKSGSGRSEPSLDLSAQAFPSLGGKPAAATEAAPTVKA